jgi:hypothetical protein
MSIHSLSKMKLVLATLATFILLVVLRFPFLHQPLIGEEGMFAMIVSGYQAPKVIDSKPKLASQIDQNCLLVIGHVGMEGDTLVRPSRNIAPYCFLGFVVKPLVTSFNLSTLNFDSKSTFIRSVFLGISGIGFASLCLLAYLISVRLSGAKQALPFLVLLGFTSVPLALGASIQPQLDGAFGFLLLSNVGLLAYCGSKKTLTTVSRLFLNFIAGFLIAFCKNEWPLTLLLSVVLVVGCSFCYALYESRLFRLNIQSQLRIRLTVGIGLALGCLVGMFLCYWFSPRDYLDGFNLMNNIHGSRKSHFKIFFQSLIFNIQILAPIIVVLLGGAWCIFKNWKSLVNEEIGLFILYIWSCGVLVGFLQSGWGGDGFPRYYLPPLLMASIFLMTQLPAVFQNMRSKAAINVWIVLIVIAAILYYGFTLVKFRGGESITVPVNYMELKKSLIGAASINQKDPYGILVHQVGLGFYFPGTNFIAADIGREAALQWPLPSPKYYLVF